MQHGLLCLLRCIKILCLLGLLSLLGLPDLQGQAVFDVMFVLLISKLLHRCQLLTQQTDVCASTSPSTHSSLQPGLLLRSTRQCTAAPHF